MTPAPRNPSMGGTLQRVRRQGRLEAAALASSSGSSGQDRQVATARLVSGCAVAGALAPWASSATARPTRARTATASKSRGLTMTWPRPDRLPPSWTSALSYMAASAR
jgi:hypothetical protein